MEPGFGDPVLPEGEPEPPAAAVLSGENGRIVFSSGRDADADALAALHLLPVPGSTGGGTVSPAITYIRCAAPPSHLVAGPDDDRLRTRGFCYVQLRHLRSGPHQSRVHAGEHHKLEQHHRRPARMVTGWHQDRLRERSRGRKRPDGRTHSERSRCGAAVTNFTNTTTAGQFEGKPAWSPDSATLYYQKGNPNAASNTDIVKRPAAGGAETLAVTDSGISEFQPSISPDGTKVCFTQSNNGFNNTADVLVAPITTPTSGGIVVSKDVALGDYNCTFSPDGTLVAYVNGTFSTGQLVMVRADNTSLFAIELAQDPGRGQLRRQPRLGARRAAGLSRQHGHDDPQHARDVHGRPARTRAPLTSRPTCWSSARTDPANGTLTQDPAGQPFTYTPNAGFTGTDSFEVRSFDGLGFGIDRGTVTISVNQPPPPPPTARCGGRTATIVGTAGNDTLVGTNGVDVIARAGRKRHDPWRTRKRHRLRRLRPRSRWWRSRERSRERWLGRRSSEREQRQRPRERGRRQRPRQRRDRP